jgi:hypothetical protein
MKCSECGADLTGAEKFCSNCGAKVPGGEAALSDVAVAAPPETFEPAQSAPILEDDAQPEEIEPTAQDAEPDTESILPFEQAPADFEPAAAEPSSAPPVVKATGNRNTGLVIAIAVLVALLLCCCCAIAFVVIRYGEQIIAALESM